MRFGWITADEWYANFSVFVEGLEERKQRFVLEIPLDTLGWLFSPGDLRVPPKRVDHLGRYSRPLAWKPWTRFHVKDTEKGPLVWEVKASPFRMWMAGKARGPYWLVMARNVLDPKEQKYFLCNASPGTPLEVSLHVAFFRWPIQRRFEDEKTELGLSHFEVRAYPSILRHLLITQVSHLFLAQQNCRLRGKNPEVTICQVRTAADALIDALPLSPNDRLARLEKAAEQLRRTQDKNARARRSHTKTRIRRLQSLKIVPEELRCCIPPQTTKVRCSTKTGGADKVGGVSRFPNLPPFSHPPFPPSRFPRLPARSSKLLFAQPVKGFRDGSRAEAEKDGFAAGRLDTQARVAALGGFLESKATRSVNRVHGFPAPPAEKNADFGALLALLQGNSPKRLFFDNFLRLLFRAEGVDLQSAAGNPPHTNQPATMLQAEAFAEFAPFAGRDLGDQHAIPLQNGMTDCPNTNYCLCK